MQINFLTKRFGPYLTKKWIFFSHQIAKNIFELIFSRHAGVQQGPCQGNCIHAVRVPQFVLKIHREQKQI
jgi:hypothetical protein